MFVMDPSAQISSHAFLLEEVVPDTEIFLHACLLDRGRQDVSHHIRSIPSIYRTTSLEFMDPACLNLRFFSPTFDVADPRWD
jgi:hypothetical protein